MPEQNGYFKVCNYTLCREQTVKLLSWHPQHPNPTLPVHPISMGNKAKPVRQIWNKTSKPFVCHTWGPQMDSHHTVD